MILDVIPTPTPRPRISRYTGGVFYDASYTVYQKKLIQALGFATNKTDLDVALTIEFVCPLMKRSKFTTPRGDVDNLAKGVMDAMTKQGFYSDDRQVVSLLATKRFATKGEDPHIKVTLNHVQVQAIADPS